MVRRLLFIGVLLLMAFETSAQVGLYRSPQVAQDEASENSINHYDNSVLYLSLLDGEEYNLVLSLSSGDHHSDKQLSFGTYTKEGDLLLLRDDLFSFVMQMEFVNDTCLRLIKGLSILKEQSFAFSGTTTFSSYRYDGTKDLLFENQEYNSCTKLDFPTGKYRNRPKGSYELDLLRRGQYEYYIDGFLISRGKWKRDGQLLVFYDDNMSQPFYAPIDKEEKKVFLAIGNPRVFPLSILETNSQQDYKALQEIKTDSLLKRRFRGLPNRQLVSLIAHVGGGWGDFPERVSGTHTDHFMGALGADAKFGLNDNWSLLIGLDYQFRFMNSGYTTYSGGIEHHSKFLQGHYLRLPVRFEYDYNRFYAVVGPYIEKGFGNMPDKYELGLVGANLELGGRLELNRNDHLRIGLLTSFGLSFENKPITGFDDNGNETVGEKHFDIGYTELNFLLRVGYEHQF